MKKFAVMSFVAFLSASCCDAPSREVPWVVDRFDDVKVIR